MLPNIIYKQYNSVYYYMYIFSNVVFWCYLYEIADKYTNKNILNCIKK